MMSVEDTLQRILAHFERLEAEDQPLLEALGQVLAEDVRSDIEVPPLDNSAMDGYAVRCQDVSEASEERPVLLSVIGEVAAGGMPEVEVKPGTAVRIMTGAPVPQGADAVVPFEYTDEPSRKGSGGSPAEIGILSAIKWEANIRRAGEDIARGALVLEKGRELRASEIGLLASLGRATARVIRRPVVSILTTGDELVDVGEPLPPGKIYNSNAYALAAQVLRCGGLPRMLGIGRDTIEALNQKIDEGIAFADLLITSGGVSKGDYDVVKDVLSQRGEILLWTVRMKPGKPLAFGVIESGDRRVPHLGLPGNPVSSMITFEQFARPALLKMMGKKDLGRPQVQAVLQEEIKNKDGRRIFARVTLSRQGSEFHAHLTGAQGSGILTSMASAHGLAILPEDVPIHRPGDVIQVQILDCDMPEWGCCAAT